MNHYHLLEHTADMGIEAQGKTMAELFRQMALGLRQIITECTDVRPQAVISLKVSGKDREELLVNWLGELLFLLESRQLLPSEFVIETIDDYSLNAQVLGETFDPDRHFIEREVKAVTYHQIMVELRDKDWYAQVFVDL